METVADLISEARVSAGMSQACLAEELNRVAHSATLDRGAITRWEQGRRVPGPFWSRWLAEVLDIDLGRLRGASRRWLDETEQFNGRRESRCPHPIAHGAPSTRYRRWTP